jgi:hypothetical protein
VAFNGVWTVNALFALIAAASLWQAAPVSVPVDASVTFSCSINPPNDGASGEGSTYTSHYRTPDVLVDDPYHPGKKVVLEGKGSYLVLTGPAPQLTLNRGGGSIHIGSMDTNPGPGFSLTDSVPGKLVYTVDSFPDLGDGWGSGPLTVTITWH